MNASGREFLIREACLDDAPAIAEIYNQAVLTTTATFDEELRTVQQQEDWLGRRDARFSVHVAIVDSRLVGWSSLNPWSSRAAYRFTAETSFYVAPEFQGRGIGRALKEQTIEAARQNGFRTLLARVVEESHASLHLNRSLGFEDVGTMQRVGYKFDRWLNVVLLQLMLEPSTSAE